MNKPLLYCVKGSNVIHSFNNRGEHFIAPEDLSEVITYRDQFLGNRSFRDCKHNFKLPKEVPNLREDCSWMFRDAREFNQDISRWDVSKVTNMQSMFWDAWEFNQDISVWNVSGVTDMSLMFHDAHKFNRDISGWDVSKVTDMALMFSGSKYTGFFGGKAYRNGDETAYVLEVL